jgi:hypothetical protein
MPIVLKSGGLNLLEPSGPVSACNGIALPLPLPLLCSFTSVSKHVHPEKGQYRRTNAVLLSLSLRIAACSLKGKVGSVSRHRDKVSVMYQH